MRSFAPDATLQAEGRSTAPSTVCFAIAQDDTTFGPSIPPGGSFTPQASPDQRLAGADIVGMHIGMIENFSDLVITLTMNAVIRDASESSETILGHSPQRLRGRAFTDFLSADSAAGVLAALRAAAVDPATGQFVRFQALSENGSWHQFEAIIRHSGEKALKPLLRIDSHQVTLVARPEVTIASKQGAGWIDRHISRPVPAETSSPAYASAAHR